MIVYSANKPKIIKASFLNTSIRMRPPPLNELMIGKHSFIDGAISIYRPPLALHQAISPLTFVGAAILVYLPPIAVQLSANEVAFFHMVVV